MIVAMCKDDTDANVYVFVVETLVDLAACQEYDVGNNNQPADQGVGGDTRANWTSDGNAPGGANSRYILEGTIDLDGPTVVHSAEMVAEGVVGTIEP